jgi:hypothetical protein
MNFDSRPILGIVSRMQQSLVHQDVFSPLHIHIQSIPGREAIEVIPEVVFETREMGVFNVRLTETAENLIEDLHFDALTAVHSGLGGR